jgi:hypothetical protein
LTIEIGSVVKKKTGLQKFGSWKIGQASQRNASTSAYAERTSTEKAC